MLLIKYMDDLDYYNEHKCNQFIYLLKFLKKLMQILLSKFGTIKI
jgi:hypothetical protein